MAERPGSDDISRQKEAAGKDRQFVTALARGLEILRCFNPGERYLGVTELARRTGLPKPTVSRLAGTLTKLGYLSFSGHYGQYQLAPGVLSLGYAAMVYFSVGSAVGLWLSTTRSTQAGARPMARTVARL